LGTLGAGIGGRTPARSALDNSQDSFWSPIRRSSLNPVARQIFLLFVDFSRTSSHHPPVTQHWRIPCLPAISASGGILWTL